ncbi:MAG: DUF3365 domain-containing protein [Gemmatimonadetes bacterium]|nr:DUF3365 domain-containing protein [Gemmatimonadota bacterium]
MASRAWWVGVAVLAAACRQDQRAPVQMPAADSATVQVARAVADSLGEELMGLLAPAIERGGPALAIQVCADSAQVRTLRHWKNGIYIRRVSNRVRNVDDTPDALERRWLEQLAEAHQAGTLPEEFVEVIRAPDGTYELQYLRPILVDRRCLACHGDPATFIPEVRAVLAQRYPEDRATGYAVGDLRGAVSVRVPLPPRP